MPGPIETAQNALTGAVSHPAAQAIGGTVATVAATPAGAVGLTVAQNIGTSAVGGVALGDASIPGLSWIVTFLFQGIKKHPSIDQNNYQWFILPILSLIMIFLVKFLFSHGDWVLSLAQAIQSCGLTAVDSAMNYKTIRPLGILGAADDPSGG